jgi:16S rRNA U516 pseudouridylate synthase RsuA-like enzyme
VAVGPIELGNLPKGKTRPLTDNEKEALAEKK